MNSFLIDRGFSPLPHPIPCVLCLGNFDGVHVAHAMLASKAKALGDELGVAAGAFCFTRPSGDYLSPSAPPHLASTHGRISYLFDAGADFVLLASFPAMRDQSPQEFIAFLEAHGCVGVVCGYDFRFAKRASGNAQTLLAHFGPERTLILPAQTIDGQRIASTAIRECIMSGQMEKATLMLGRPWELRARVCHGKSLAATWGFPTANQYFSPQSVIPAHGVYAVRCTVDGVSYDGVCNVGLRPTTDRAARVNCETHLFDFDGDLYGKVMSTAFYTYLRPEQKFEDAAALRAAIARDAQTAREYFKNLK